MSHEQSFLDFGVDLGDPIVEEKKEENKVNKTSEKSSPVKESQIAKNRVKPAEEIKVTGEWTIHFATETFKVSDFVEEIPEEGISLEDVREALERNFAQFSAARTHWDVDKENKKLFPDAFAGSKGGDLPMQVPFFTNMEEANKYEGSLSYVAGVNGQVYEYRKSYWGDLIVKTNLLHHSLKVVEGLQDTFRYHLPKIPAEQLMKVFSFFKSYTMKGKYEVMICVYWDKEEGTYILDCPKQTVTSIHIDKYLNPNYGGRHSLRYLKVLEVHSHNVMEAYFSKTDDADEQQFGLYGVVGKLNQRVCEFKLRVKVNDSQMLIHPAEVVETDFNGLSMGYPKEWDMNVQLEGGSNNENPFS